MPKVFNYFGYIKLKNSDQLLVELENSIWTADAAEYLKSNNITIHTKTNHATWSDIIIFEFENEEEATMFALKFV